MHDSLTGRWFSVGVNTYSPTSLPVQPGQSARDYLIIQRVFARGKLPALKPPRLPTDLDH